MSKKRLLHGIDPYAPGGLAKLFAHHRQTFGDAVMEADPAGAPTPTPTDPPAAPADPDPKAGDGDLGDPGKRALAAEREAAKTAKREAAELKAELQKYKDAEKSAEELAAEKLTAAEKAAEKSTRKALQYEAAAAKGLPLSAASRLVGSTKEELEADAEKLAELIGSKPPQSPKPDPSQGGGSGDPAKPKNLADAIKGHYA